MNSYWIKYIILECLDYEDLHPIASTCTEFAHIVSSLADVKHWKIKVHTDYGGKWALRHLNNCKPKWHILYEILRSRYERHQCKYHTRHANTEAPNLYYDDQLLYDHGDIVKDVPDSPNTTVTCVYNANKDTFIDLMTTKGLRLASVNLFWPKSSINIIHPLSPAGYSSWLAFKPHANMRFKYKTDNKFYDIDYTDSAGPSVKFGFHHNAKRCVKINYISDTVFTLTILDPLYIIVRDSKFAIRKPCLLVTEDYLLK